MSKRAWLGGLLVLFVSSGASGQALLSTRAQQIISSYWSALASVSTSSVTAKSLSIFYGTCAAVAVIEDDIIIPVSDQSARQWWFAVCAIPRGSLYADSLGGAFYDCESNILLLYDSGLSRIGKVVVLGHELQIAQSSLLGGPRCDAETNDEWLFGEVLAFRTVSRILEEITLGKWSALVEDGRRRRMDAGLANDAGILLCDTNTYSADSVAVTGLFPERTDADMGILLEQLATDINIRQIELDHLDDPVSQNELAIAFLVALYTSRY